jgi:hypothetical protein
LQFPPTPCSLNPLASERERKKRLYFGWLGNGVLRQGLLSWGVWANVGHFEKVGKIDREKFV